MNSHHKEKINDLDSKVYKAMFNHSQFVIDMIEKAQEEAREDNLHPDSLGALCYEIGNALEIINPERTHDIEVLKELKEVLSTWEKELREKKAA